MATNRHFEIAGKRWTFTSVPDMFGLNKWVAPVAGRSVELSADDRGQWIVQIDGGPCIAVCRKIGLAAEAGVLTVLKSA